MSRRREEAFYAAHLEGTPQPEDAIACEAARFLPSRNAWRRPRAAEREGLSSEEIAVRAILRTMYGYRQAGKLDETTWGRELTGLVTRVNARIERVDFAFEPPRILLKRKNRDDYRALAAYENIEDRLVLGGISRYLRERFDPFLSPRCYSFRADPERSHQAAVAELIAYRQAHRGETLYVAECDIMKFFDAVDPREARKAFGEFAAKCGGIDERARRIVEAYFASYSFEEAMARAKEVGRAGRATLPLEKLSHVARVPETVLSVLHPGEDFGKLRLGLPQGGALSPLFANILLSGADDAVVGAETDPDLLYIRFCDDMIIVHTDRGKCAAAMKRYLDAVGQRKLPVHAPEAGGFVYGKGYYKAKTKGPFAWRRTWLGERNAAPWVSFLGYQVNFNGETRVRRETVHRHLLSLKGERIRFEQRIGAASSVARPDALIRHFRAHLVAKGIGFLRAGAIPEDSLCWAAAFPNLRATASRECRLQMRVIDAVRDRMIRISSVGAGRSVIGPYLGRPFSYLGYLLRKVRPERHLAKRAARVRVMNDWRAYGLI